jgi:signal transduction histidine kinase
MQHFPQLAAIAITQAENDEARRRFEAFLASVQRVSGTGSFSWRTTAVEVMASQQVYRIFDLDPAMPLTLELLAGRIHPDDRPNFHEQIGRARTAVVELDFEPRILAPDGSVKYLHVMAHAIRNDPGQMEYLGAVHEVTNRRRSQEALGRSQAALTRVGGLTTLGILVPVMASEVTQPLTGIMTNASTCLRMLAADPPGLDGARAAARRALRDVERARDLITRLRLLGSRKEAWLESLDLNDAIREAIALMASELQKQRVVLKTELDSELPRVGGVQAQIQQVLLNLLVNSLEAMSDVEDRPKHLLIKTERQEGARVCVIVRDAGRGFHPGDAERLFEASYTTKMHGVGIGLFISRTIVERHRGRLWAALNEGHGATFSFSIPHDHVQSSDG